MSEAEEIAQLRRELAQARQEMTLRSTPVEQRAALQQQMERQAEADQLASQRQQLDDYALEINASKLSLETGLPAEQFTGLDSIQAQNQHALAGLQGLLKNPEALGLLTRRLTPVGEAPGASTPVAGAPTNGNAESVQPSVTEELLGNKQFGRGTGDLEGYMAALRANEPMQDLRLGAAAAAPAPVPVVTPEAAPAGAAAPAS